MENANRVASSEQGCVESRFEEIIGDKSRAGIVLRKWKRVGTDRFTVLVIGEDRYG